MEKLHCDVRKSINMFQKAKWIEHPALMDTELWSDKLKGKHTLSLHFFSLCCKMSDAFIIIPNGGASWCLVAYTGLNLSWMPTVFPCNQLSEDNGTTDCVTGAAHRSHECTMTAAQCHFKDFSRHAIQKTSQHHYKDEEIQPCTQNTWVGKSITMAFL